MLKEDLTNRRLNRLGASGGPLQGKKERCDLRLLVTYLSN